MHQRDPLIREGDTVVISGGSVMKTALVKRSQMIRIGNAGMFNVGSLIGHRFGDVFEYNQQRKVLIPSILHPDLDRTDIREPDDEKRDNRDLLDSNQAQALREEEIVKRKELGVKDLVDQLIESSTTYEKKTAFAQEKYVRRKRTKYAVLFKVDRLTTETLAEVCCPSRIELLSPASDSRHLRLRVDTVAQMLTHGNIHSNVRCLVRENTNGVLSAAILERMTEEGIIYHALPRQAHANDYFAKQMRLPNVTERVVCIPYSQYLVSDEAESPKRAENSEDPESSKPSKGDGEVAEAPLEQAEQAQASATSGRWLKARAARDLFAVQPVDSLIVAEGDPKQSVLELLQFVSYGGSIVVFCPYLEPLCQLFGLLRQDVVCIRLWDTWLREYQVLPGRTHPTVNMNAGGGYLLSCIKVEPAPPTPSLPGLADETLINPPEIEQVASNVVESVVEPVVERENEELPEKRLRQ